MNKRPVANASAMLQSQIPGLRVQIGTGEPGNQGISFRVRGQGTFSSAGSDPLILINGVPGSLDNIDPSTVESVSVLKDAASAAVYGARAANGVVLVTTKTGENTPLTVSYRGNVLWSSPTRMFDLISDPAEYMTLYNQAADNSGRAPGDRYPTADIEKYRSREAGYEGYDWLGENITTSLSHNHNLTLLGGTDKMAYNAALNYVDEKGTMKAFEHQKFNFTLNMQSKLNKYVTAGTYVNLNRYDRSSPRQGSEDAFLALMSQAPTYGPQRSDGTWTKKAYMFEDPNKNIPAIIGNNALAGRIGYETSGHLWMTVNLLEGLSWHTKGAATMRTSKVKDWRPIVPVYMYRDGAAAGNLDVGGKGLGVTDSHTLYTYLYSYLKYDFALAEQVHKFGLQFGYSQESNMYEELYGYRDTYNFPLLELNAGSASMQENSGKTEEWALMGVFGRFNYNFKERYLFEANFRYDGTSRISPEGRWGLFPSVSAGWRITEESFVKNIAPQWVNNVKVRASWGQLGNQNIGLYPWQALIASGQNYTFDNVGLPTGYAQTAMANRDLKWETTTTTDIGLDFTLFGGLNATFGWYKKVTSDILRGSQLTGLVGLDAPTVNNGGMTNTGIELDLRYNGLVKEGALKGLTYSAGFYLDRYRNELTDFGAREISGYNLREEGKPWDSYYLLDCIGVFADQSEIDRSPKQFSDNIAPGDLKYRDADGDGDVDADDRVVVDGRFPSMEYAFSASAAWKGFDISLLMAGVAGKKWYVDWWGTWPFLQASPPTRAYIEGMWTEQNPHGAKHPKLYANDIGGDKNKRASTYYLQDASFMRVKNLTVGYTLPAKLTQKMFIQNLRIYFSGDNLFTFTSYPELDPERDSDGRMVKYPQNKVFSLGLNVSF
jgi:TonB-linked SusC/RagA family outer membrane protein